MNNSKKILSWKEIKSKYPDMWVAISNFSDDLENVVHTQGEIYASANAREELATILEQKEDTPLAITYTGDRNLKDFQLPLWYKNPR